MEEKTYPFIVLKYVVLPSQQKEFVIYDKKYLETIEKSQLNYKGKIVIFYSKSLEKEELKKDKINPIGCLCIIKDFIKREKVLIVIGQKRVRMKEVDFDNLIASVEEDITIPLVKNARNDAIIKAIGDISIKFLQYVNENNIFGKLFDSNLLKILWTYPSNIVIQTLDNFAKYFSTESQLQLLNELDENKRIEIFVEILKDELKANELHSEITKKALKELDAEQKKVLLQKQLEKIKEELGESSDKNKDIEYYEKLMKEKNLPKYARKRIEKQLKRLKNLPVYSPETGTIKNYIETVLELPWGNIKQPIKDINKIKATLDKNHYGLEQIKERILEYISVFLKTNKPPINVLCFVGPPGTGKTTLVNSIAEALGLDYYHIALGGIRDEAEIRGFQYTYIGAKPGKIIKALIDCGTDNPVICLDEIDKVGKDWRGDPIAALMEVLDPEQNYQFEDHYLDLKYDISKVLFICTANYLYNINPVLLDRLEVIELRAYTDVEKFYIAKKHLIPRQKKLTGLENENIEITDKAIKKIINEYTIEPGVRNLERCLAKIYRKIVKESISIKKEIKSKIIDEKTVEKYLDNKINKNIFLKNRVGVVNGLAYTEYGGSLIQIEVLMYKGKGKINFTGNLGNILKESAQVAFSYVKANKDKYKINEKVFTINDFHIHIPGSASSIKEGPSAGVTLTTALLSKLLNKEVPKNIAMTGEISLSGEILPIGGLKEKIIAGKRYNINTFFIPKQNKDDIKKLPKYLLKNIKIIYVEHYDEIFNKIFKE